MATSPEKTNTTISSIHSQKISYISFPKHQQKQYHSSPDTTNNVPIAKKLKTNHIITPCAACKILRRRCVQDKCVLAPYFPPSDPCKFAIAHRVFGASNLIKLLQDLPESQRADAVSSLVYEATARTRDPIYGSAGTICYLQKQVSDLQAELAKTQAELVNLQCQQNNLMTLICTENTTYYDPQQSVSQLSLESRSFMSPDDINLNSIWELI